jgi:hypothetical protein
MAHRPGISPYHRFLVFTVVALALRDQAAAVPVVWNGPSISFSKVGNADPTEPENQDRITDNVWITRVGPVQGGIFNAVTETAYVRYSSPADTEWATDVIPANSGKTISASNWEELVFTPWAEAYGGPGFGLGDNILVKNAVVHLITDDIYLNLKFTQFVSTGTFAYDRSTAGPGPSGDYNQNDVVDAGDYVVWRNTLNQSVTPSGSGADGNSNWTIDTGDHAYWAARFGNTVPPSDGGSAIPEPASCLLLVALGGVTVAASYLRRRPARTK